MPAVAAFDLTIDGSGRMYVGLDDRGVYAQTPDRQSWQPLSVETSLASAAVLSLAVSTDGQQLYAGTAGQGVFSSQDGGQSWHATYEGEFAPNLTLHPLDPTIALVSLRNRLVRTVDGGHSWHTLPLPWAKNEIVSLLWLEQGMVVAGTGHGELFFSQDNGDTWLAYGQGLAVGGGVLDLAVAEQSGAPQQVLAATWTGIYGSNNGGEQWHYLSPTLGNPNAQDLLSANDTLFIGTRSGLFTWQPDRAQWQAVEQDFRAGIASLTADPQNQERLYVGTSGQGIYVSEDAGHTWQHRRTINPSVPDIVVDPRDTDRLYILAAWERVYETLDRGTSWQARWGGLSQLLETTTLAIDSRASTLYAGSFAGLYRSESEAAWQLVSPTLIDESILALLVQPNNNVLKSHATLYMGTTRGVYRTRDGGTTIERSPAWGQGLENISVTALLADPDNSDYLYAGTAYAGIYQSLDGGETWHSIGPDTFQNDVVEALAWGPAGELFAAGTINVWRAVRQ
ncbi:MAG: hypothetical protein AAF485_03860 [Chloroflexota bacterium]